MINNLNLYMDIIRKAILLIIAVPKLRDYKWTDGNEALGFTFPIR
jgi:hypothetical protein